MTKIKMCGMTQEADVAVAVELGVDAVGFVLWNQSPRAATPAAVARIVRGLPPFVTPVAVLVDPTCDDLVRAFDDAGCRAAQIHGRFEAGGLPDRSWPIVRAVTLGEEGDAIVPTVDRDVTVLLDAHDPVRHGGTGRRIDWTRASLVARRRRVILAGGLTPANVGEAVRTVRPYGVDVASGIEREPGRKDRDAMRTFVAAVRAADYANQTQVDELMDRQIDR